MKSHRLRYELFKLFVFTLCTFISVGSSFAAGRVDVNDGVTIIPETVTVGNNFDVSFQLKEFQGESKTFETVQLWIQDGNGNDLFDAQTWNNVSFAPNEQIPFSTTTFLDPARGRGPGSYRAIARGTVAGDAPFNLYDFR